MSLLFAYAEEVLAFAFAGERTVAAIPPAPAPDALKRMALRCVQALERSGRSRLLLLGLGSGALAGELAASLTGGALCVCELDLSLVRALHAAGRLAWRRPDQGAELAADASAWAVFLLLDRAGIASGEALVLPNPELPPAAKARLRTLELLLARARPLELPETPAGNPPRISAAAILAPGEPCLPEFFAQFPAWLHELVLVWDAEHAPRERPEGLAPGLALRQLARPLGGDFSAQRNAMLEACTGDFVLYLDADERLAPHGWASLPRLCAPDWASAWHFPRLTPYPDAAHALTGFGLWPDLQLRLFRRAPGLRFVNPVHERLTGVEGTHALAPDVEIEHLSRLRKGVEDLQRKLSGFDAASGGRLRHALNSCYPKVPRAWLASARSGAARGLLLPGAEAAP